MKQIKRIIVDGDTFPYHACGSALSAAETAGLDMTLAFCTNHLDHHINKIATELAKATGKVKDGKPFVKFDTIYMQSDEPRHVFRYKIYPEYKANRKVEKPPFYEEVREYMINKYGCVVVHGIESDDACSIELAKDPEATIVVQNDKDGRQDPGWHYWYNQHSKYNRKLFYVDINGILLLEKSSGKTDVFATGNYQLAYQMLRGDSVDNIPAIAKGWTPVKCYEFLNQFPGSEVITRVRDLYHELYGEKSKLLFNTNWSLVKMLDEWPSDEKIKHPEKYLKVS